MCGRYLTPDQAAFERHWGLPSPPNYFQSYNVAPSQSAAVIRVDADGGLDAELMNWGFQPSWAKRGWINARSETAFASKAFASATRDRRCIIPAVGWYEWQGAKPPKQPYLFHTDGFMPLGFAGIWTSREAEQGLLRSYAILTREAYTEIENIHHRMPVILNQSGYACWTSVDTTVADARALINEPFDGITTYPVSAYVNKPANNDARCIQSIS